MGLKEILSRLKARDASLIELNLQRNQIGAQGAVALALALKEKSTVTSINLMNNNIGD